MAKKDNNNSIKMIKVYRDTGVPVLESKISKQKQTIMRHN
jgi:hypothetical protein